MHGKDRTGMVIMLVMLLCDCGPQVNPLLLPCCQCRDRCMACEEYHRYCISWDLDTFTSLFACHLHAIFFQCITRITVWKTLACTQAALLDYAQSEVQLRTARDSRHLDLASEYLEHASMLTCPENDGHGRLCASSSDGQYLAGHLTTDAVLASSAHVMQSTIDYMNQKWGSAAGYATAIGITSTEMSRLRLNLMKEAAPKDLMSRLTPS